MRGWRLALGIATAIAVVAAGSAASAPQVTEYSRVSATASFVYSLDYGDNHDDVHNGTYKYWLIYRLNAIAVYDGRNLSVSSGSMLAAGGATIIDNRTEWAGPTSRVRVRCSERAHRDPDVKHMYKSETNGARFSSGGGIGVSAGRLSINPGQAIAWSIGCSGGESLANHGLPGGPGFRVPAPPKRLFTGSKAFSIGCGDSYSHEFERGTHGGGAAHRFDGYVRFDVRFTPFPASELTATKKRLRDRVGKPIPFFESKSPKDCP